MSDSTIAKRNAKRIIDRIKWQVEFAGACDFSDWNAAVLLYGLATVLSQAADDLSEAASICNDAADAQLP